MAEYIVRIELNGSPSWQQYERLHGLMRKAGFSRTVRGDSGMVYDLPHAVYYCDTTASRNQVWQAADGATKQVWKGYQILCIESSGMTFSGLQQHGNQFTA